MIMEKQPMLYIRQNEEGFFVYQCDKCKRYEMRTNFIKKIYCWDCEATEEDYKKDTIKFNRKN